MPLRQGDRVRIRRTPSEYTGCRGTIIDPDPDDAGLAILGRLVAIDGENGVARPFLIGELERLQPAKVVARTVAEERAAHSSSAAASPRTPPNGSGAD